MAHFSMNAADHGDESSDSDHRQKRRKTNPMSHSKPNGSTNPGASPAANSFAAKMMAKMGYVEGQGLGATGRGRLAPIESQLRPQGAGLGAVKEKTNQAKEEEKREAAFRGEVVEESSEEEKKRRRKLKEKRASDGTNAVGIPRKAKPKYKMAADMEAAAEGLEVPNVLMSLIDARGQDTKLLTSTAGLMNSQTMVPSETESSKIARRARRDLEAFTDEWTALMERKIYFEAQEAHLTLEIEKDGEEGENFRDMKDMIDAAEDLQRVNLDDDLDDTYRWEACTKKFESFQRSNTGQPSVLQELAVAALHPLFKHEMQKWEPLKLSREPKGGLPYLKRLQQVLIPQREFSTELALQDGDSYSIPQTKSTTHYETMIYSLWLPPMRSAITNDWGVYQDSDALIDLLQAWKPVLPPFIWANVIDQLVAKRLTGAVAAWKPRNAQKSHRNSSRPPHVWLFPWLQYLDEQHTDPKSSTGLLSEVKRKFKSVLSTWNLSTSLPVGLEEWRTVLQSELSSMLVRHLLPRLALHLSTYLIIDPSDQDLTPLEDVLRWAPFFPLETMAHLLIAEFFPKWHQTLYVWLTYEGVNYADVKNWYSWWKEQVLGKALSAGFNELSSIAGEWNKGLETMSQALDLLEKGMDVSTHLPAPSLDMSSELNPGTPTILTPTASKSSGPPPPPFTSSTTPHTFKAPQIDNPITFKDVVEEWCAENGLLLFPLREADLQTGLPLFRITASASGRGGVVVYLKGDVVWVRGIATAGTEKRIFMPVGLDETLVAKAEAR
ncbi:hypothetical protein HO133_002355 [Letharia lupina]|uniref:G-patch domain-containing protein n=1 Tax=Letharia lupina TaxID=560253 RepID=A0A8H6CE06_9LECA|nr:uncharacterized protein HO133_002355 [Letharia lupina]KAF6221499.1 hypothetical protein HO133_002355 [Letharia lupina]